MTSSSAPANHPVSAISIDRPIRSASEDRFGRQGFALAMAKHIASLPLGDSHVVSLNGTWGTGKTSLVELLVAELRTLKPDSIVLWYNPWMFTGVGSLLRQFFSELGAQLREKHVEVLTQTAAALNAYELRLSQGVAIAPPEGLEALMRDQWRRLLGPGHDAKGHGSIFTLRREIESLLSKSARQVLIVVDDIDRLPAAEIREVIRLVRLVADFPNTAYLLCYDKPIVEAALTETSSNGREYLKKIVQFSFDVPLLRHSDLHRFMLERLTEATANLQTGPFDQELWAPAFTRVIGPLVTTVRDAKRFVNAAKSAIGEIGEEVALVDLLCLEGARLFLPEFWVQLPAYREHITGVGQRDKSKVAVLDPLLEAAGERKDVALELMRNLFPGSRRWIDNHFYDVSSLKEWRRERKVAHEEVFNYYFQRTLPEDVLPAVAVKRVVSDLGDRELILQHIAKLSPPQLEALFSRLEDYEEVIPEDSVEIALPVLLNEANRMREGRQGFYDFGADLAAGRIALRFLRVIKEEAKREEVLRRIVPALSQHSRRLDLVETAGTKERVGHSLVATAVAEELELEIAADVAAASAHDLSKERNLFLLVGWLYREHPDFFPPAAQHLREVGPLVRLLGSALSEAISGALSTGSVRTQEHLPWEYLKTLVGDDLDAMVGGLDLESLR